MESDRLCDIDVGKARTGGRDLVIDAEIQC